MCHRWPRCIWSALDYQFPNHDVVCRPNLSICHIWPTYIQSILVHKTCNCDLWGPDLSICHMWLKYIQSILVHKACKDDKYPAQVTTHIVDGGLWWYPNHSNCDVHGPTPPVSHRWTKCIQIVIVDKSSNAHGPNQFGLFDGSVSYWRSSIQFSKSSSNILYACKQILDTRS